MNKITKQHWDVFISYASEDQAVVADPLAHALRDKGLLVWYDQSELKVGDSLRRKIDEGLNCSDYGIVVLSPHFFAKHFTNLELNGLTQREVNGNKVILSIWHNVNYVEVRRFSPPLAERVAAKWKEGISAVVEKLLVKVRPDIRNNQSGLHAIKSKTDQPIVSAYQGDVCPKCKKGTLYFLDRRPGPSGFLTEWYKCSECQAVLPSNRSFNGGLV